VSRKLKGINAMDPPPYAKRLHSARMISGSDIHVMLALRRSFREVVVADKQLDGTDMMRELLGKRQRFADEP
jgi:hypothetical protein